MAVNKLCNFWRKATLNRYRTGIVQAFHRFESTSGNVVQETSSKSSWKFLFLAFGLPGSGFLLYKTVIEPGTKDLSEEEKKMTPFMTRFMIKYFMEDPIENKQKIHDHIKACRDVANKRLYLNHVKQKEIAPGNFKETIAREKENISYDPKMY